MAGPCFLDSEGQCLRHGCYDDYVWLGVDLPLRVPCTICSRVLTKLDNDYIKHEFAARLDVLGYSTCLVPTCYT